MTKFGSSQPVRRLEDTRFITGHGRYIDDTAPEGALRCYVLRSPMAHGRITTLDVSDAREAPGVALVLTAADIPARGLKNAIEGFDRGQPRRHEGRGPGAADPRRTHVRHVGEAVAFVVAETLAAGADAAELIELDIEDMAGQARYRAGRQPAP
jgi:carbon-monoxide dehydrogenase large subunit